MKMIVKILAVIMLLLPMLLHASDSKSVTIYANNPTPAPVTFSSAYATFYSLSATPQTGWAFTPTFGISGYSGWYESASYCASCEKIVVNDIQIATVWIDAATAFSVTINGEMYKSGGTGGSLINWSVTGTSNAAAIIMHLDPSEAVVALGDPKSFAYKTADDTALYGLWWDSSKTPSFNTGNYSAIGPTYNFSSTTAGQYTLTAARNGAGDKSASATVKNVEVKSLAAGTSPNDIVSEIDNPGPAQTYYVAKGSSAFNITATPNPSGWPDNYPTWTVDGSPAGTPGDTSYSFNPTAASNYTVAAHCGTSTKAIKIVVVDLKIKRGTTDVTMPDTGNPSPIDVYIGQKNDFSAEVTPSGLSPSYSWTIPGTKIKNWVEADAGPTLTALLAADLASQSLYFYWLDGFTSNSVSVTVTVGGKNFSKSSIPFHVIKPTNPMSPVMQSTVQYTPPGGVLSIYLCNPSIPAEGTVFNAQNYPTQTGTLGTFKYVQVITSSSRTKTKNDDTVETIYSFSNELDKEYPYPYPADSPGNSYPDIDDYKKLSVDDNFKTYLMYNPGGDTSIDVPISYFTWNWKAYSNRTGSPGSYTWQAPVDSSSKNNNTITTTHPTWSGKH